MLTDVNSPHQRVIGKSADSKKTLLQGAVEGHVLVKNANAALPLKDPKLVSVFGCDAVNSGRGLTDDYSDTLITNLAKKCSNTIIVIHNAGIRLVDDWVQNGNITPVMFAHLPGQDTGRSLVDLLYGRANPSDKLPYTVTRRLLTTAISCHPPSLRVKYLLFPQDDSPGQFIGYRALTRSILLHILNLDSACLTQFSNILA